jgi:hypothetical protein
MILLYLVTLVLWCIMAGAILDLKKIEDDVQFRKKFHPIGAGRDAPSFFIIGAPKCATTSLYDLFVKHTSICRSSVKEVHYFDQEEKWQRGASFYKNHFDVGNCGRKAKNRTNPVYFMDSTPDYFPNKLVPVRMHRSFSEADRLRKRFILILREPVEREYSWYNHRARFCTRYMHTYMERHRAQAQAVKNGVATWNVKELCGDPHCRSSCSNVTAQATLNHEVEYIANFTQYMRNGDLLPQKSAYVHHLQHWLTYFNRSQFFIVNLDTLLTNTTDTVERMLRFLDLPPFPQRTYDDSGQIKLPHSNSARMETTFDCAVRTALYPFYAPLNEQLYALLRQTDATAADQYATSARNDSSTDSTSKSSVGYISEHEPPFPPFVTKSCAPGQLY